MMNARLTNVTTTTEGTVRDHSLTGNLWWLLPPAAALFYPQAVRALYESGKRLHRASWPDGVDHIVEVAFAANIKTHIEVLTQGGSIATYATNPPVARVPVWQLVFINTRIFF